MISNELLTEVLKSESWYWDKAKTRAIDKMYLLDDETNFWMIDFTDGAWSCVNIYELAHKCKEWAVKHEDNISFISFFSGGPGSNTCDLCIHEDEDTKKVNFYADTEPEAIFKACEWILQQTDQKENKW